MQNCAKSEFLYIFLGLWMARFCSGVGEVTRSQDAWISCRVLDCMRNLQRNLLDIVAGTAWQLLFAGRQKRLIPQPWWNWHLLMAPWQKSHSLLTAQGASCSTFPCKHLIDILQILSVFITWHPSANCIKLRSKPFLLWTIQFIQFGIFRGVLSNIYWLLNRLGHGIASQSHNTVRINDLELPGAQSGPDVRPDATDTQAVFDGLT